MSRDALSVVVARYAPIQPNTTRSEALIRWLDAEEPRPLPRILRTLLRAADRECFPSGPPCLRVCTVLDLIQSEWAGSDGGPDLQTLLEDALLTAARIKRLKARNKPNTHTEAA